MDTLHLTNVPLLVGVSCSTKVNGIENSFKRLSRCLSQLQVLKLNGTVLYNSNHVIPTLPNLKHLELRIEAHCVNDLHQLICLIKASPCLHRLVVKLNEETKLPDEMKIVNNTINFPRHYIKEIEIVGYRVSDSHVQQVMYLVENALALKKIVIDPVRRWCAWPREGDGGNEHQAAVAEMGGRYHAKTYLRAKMPSTVEFVCL